MNIFQWWTRIFRPLIRHSAYNINIGQMPRKVRKIRSVWPFCLGFPIPLQFPLPPEAHNIIIAHSGAISWFWSYIAVPKVLLVNNIRLTVFYRILQVLGWRLIIGKFPRKIRKIRPFCHFLKGFPNAEMWNFPIISLHPGSEVGAEWNPNGSVGNGLVIDFAEEPVETDVRRGIAWISV